MISALTLLLLHVAGRDCLAVKDRGGLNIKGMTATNRSSLLQSDSHTRFMRLTNRLMTTLVLAGVLGASMPLMVKQAHINTLAFFWQPSLCTANRLSPSFSPRNILSILWPSTSELWTCHSAQDESSAALCVSLQEQEPVHCQWHFTITSPKQPLMLWRLTLKPWTWPTVSLALKKMRTCCCTTRMAPSFSPGLVLLPRSVSRSACSTAMSLGMSQHCTA